MTTSFAPTRVPGFGDAVRSEFTKFLSVRSSRVLLVVSVVLAAAVAAILVATLPTTRKVAMIDVPARDVFTSPLLGVDAAALVMVVAAATYFGSEFTRKQALTTFAVTPDRVRVVLAKLVVVAVVGAVVAVVVTAVCVTVGRSVAGSAGASLIDPTAAAQLQTAAGSALQPIFYAVVAGAIAVMTRSAAGAIGAGVVLVLVLPAFAGFLPPAAAQVVAPLLPRAAFDSIAGVAESGAPEHVSLWWAVPLLVVWTLVFVVLAVRDVRRRDV